MKFGDIIQKINTIAEEDRQAMIAIAAKYPDLDSAIVPADEHQVLANRFSAAEGKYTEWETWAYGPKDPTTGVRSGGKWSNEHKMTTAQFRAEQDLAQARSTLAELQAGTYTGGTDMDMKAVTDLIAQQGFVKADDVKGFAKAADMESRLNTHGATLEHIFARTANLSLRYMQEFGKAEFDMEGFLKHITSDPTGDSVRDPTKAYETYVAAKRFEVQTAKLKEREDALVAKEQELETKRTSSSSPTDIGEGANIPPFQKMIQGSDGDKPKLADGIPFGTGQLGNEIAKLYRSEQSARVQ